jgi:ElaB/YqjD/DUF883 family membrane-anchored ribosome-binding protein
MKEDTTQKELQKLTEVIHSLKKDIEELKATSKTSHEKYQKNSENYAKAMEEWQKGIPKRDTILGILLALIALAIFTHGFIK